MSGNAGVRLARLEAIYRTQPGCDACRRWMADVMVFRDRPARAECCGRCGRCVPIRRVITFPTIDWERL